MRRLARFPRIALGALAVALVPLLLWACRQAIGIDEYFNATAGACGAHYGTGACASCASTSCCGESTACASDPVCDAYEGCLGKCLNGDPKCRSQCTIDNPVGTSSTVSALSACLAGKCENECGLTCGAMAAYITPPDASAPCEKCFESACGQTRACASSVDCDEYTRCFVACPTPDCREACATTHDAGAVLFGPVQQAYANTCSKACAYGQNWNCVGHVVYPATKITAITQTWTLLDYSTGMAVPGVEACLSYNCATCGSPGVPYAMTQTDANGLATATLQLPAISAFGGTQPSFQGCWRLSSPNIVTSWGVFGFPQTQAKWSITPAYVMTSSTPDEWVTILTAIGVTRWDPSRAILGMRVYDCLGTPAPKVQVALDPAAEDSLTSVWYSSGSPTATSVSANNGNATGSSGIAAFINVLAPDAGSLNVSLTATPVGLGKVSSTEVAGVQAGVQTQVEMTPTP